MSMKKAVEAITEEKKTKIIAELIHKLAVYIVKEGFPETSIIMQSESGEKLGFFIALWRAKQIDRLEFRLEKGAVAA